MPSDRYTPAVLPCETGGAMVCVVTEGVGQRSHPDGKSYVLVGVIRRKVTFSVVPERHRTHRITY